VHGISYFRLIKVSLTTVRFYENKEKKTILSIKCELHSSVHVLCPHLFSALRSGCTQKRTEPTSNHLLYFMLPKYRYATENKVAGILRFSDDFTFLLLKFHKFLN